MKKLMSMLIVMGTCLCFAVAFAGGKDEAPSAPVKGEKASQQAEPKEENPEGYSSPEPQKAELTKLKGEITAITPDSGQITIGDGSGNGVILTAGKAIDLTDFNVGDRVVLEYDSDMLITSLNKQGKE